MADRGTGPAAGLALRGARVHFGTVRAVDDLTLEVAPGSFTALLGPSGCGKSSALAAIAGLLELTDGDVLVDGASLRGLPPERRPVSLVFQKPLLFPHLTVAQNVAFGLRMLRTPRDRTRREVGDMLERVRLGALAGRRVGELSGGQEQRVSLARALVLRPRVLLLDEPFSQLDADLRREMRALVRGLHDESDVTTVFVTHDQDEAVEVADEIALMLDGSLAGRGTPETFYTRPPSLAAARFFGSTNELRGCVRDGGFATRDGSVRLPVTGAPGPALLVIRPESVLLARPDRGPAGATEATVRSTRFAGSHVVVELTLADGQPLRAHAPVGTTITPGDRCGVVLPPERCTAFPEPGPAGGDRP